MAIKSDNGSSSHMKWLKQIPTSILIAAAIFLGLAPFFPEPHIVEKLHMLSQGNLRKPLDVFDLFFHLLPVLLLILKLSYHSARNK
ncbi:MAG: RND transporter [Desulfobulbaceae bacterium]|nr:RND transporter [Desulfobulbaceae bacterium]